MNAYFTAITILTSVIGVAAPTLAAKPVAPDPCNGVTEDTFPSFVFAKTVEASQNVWETGTFLADETGKCTRLVSYWPGASNFRYNKDSHRALILTMSGGHIVVGLSSVSFGIDGPAATWLDGPTSILNIFEIAPEGWTIVMAEAPRMSPDGTQLLMKIGLTNDSDPTVVVGPSLWTCDLSYDPDTTIIQPIDPASCREVYQFGLNANWHEIAAWGVLPGTIYVTQPSVLDKMKNSLYRLTVGQGPEETGAEEVFKTAGNLMGARASAAPLDASTVNGEIVAVYEGAPPGSTRCSKVIVIDAYNCSDLTCALNQKGMRSMTWLPDGRLAGRGQTPPKKGNGTCLENESIVAYPAIDSANTPPTVLTTTPSNSLPYSLCRTCIEGSAGGW